MANSNTNVVFVGPSASGKTAALCLLHYTVMDYKKNEKFALGIDRYTPNIRSAGYDFFRDANALVQFGSEIEPTAPGLKDLKIELQFHFKGLLRGKEIDLIFADMAGPISAALMKVFPDLTPAKTPDEVEAELKSYAIKSDDAKYLVKHILDADGLILIADASKIGKRGPENPDGPLASYLNNLLNYIERVGKTPKGIALLLTKFDRWYTQFGPNPDKAAIENFVTDKLPTVWTLITSLNENKGVHYNVFYSGLQESRNKPEEAGGDGAPPSKFLVAEDSQGHQRVVYNIEQYAHLIRWIKEVFQ